MLRKKVAHCPITFASLFRLFFDRTRKPRITGQRPDERFCYSAIVLVMRCIINMLLLLGVFAQIRGSKVRFLLSRIPREDSSDLVEQRTFVDERHFFHGKPKWTENPFKRSLPLQKSYTRACSVAQPGYAYRRVATPAAMLRPICRQLESQGYRACVRLAKNVLRHQASRYTGLLRGKHTLHEVTKLHSIAYPFPEDDLRDRWLSFKRTVFYLNDSEMSKGSE